MVRLSRPRRRAAAGGGVGRGGAAGRDLLPARQRVRGRRRRLGARGRLDRDALPRLKLLFLRYTAIGDAGLVALAPALRRRPALERLFLRGNPLGDEGLAALVAPPPPAGAPPPTMGGLAKLQKLDLSDTQIADAGCDALAAALDSGTLPALEYIYLAGIPASAAAKRAVFAARSLSGSQ